MTTYVIADIKVTDDSWVPEYAANVHDIVHKHGGKYLTRTSNIKTVEGQALDTTLIALIEFPTAEAFEAFAGDVDYSPFTCWIVPIWQGQFRTLAMASRVYSD
jgi:uncharacterized protein (DUF1330 family)